MGNLDSKEGRDAYPIIKSMIPWSEKLYDMTPEQVEEYRNVYKEEYHKQPECPEREVMDVFYIEYQYYQLRRTYQWVLDQYKLSGDKQAVRREILLQRLRGSTESPLDPEDIEYLIANMKKSVKDIIIDDKWKFILYDHGQGYVGGVLKDLDENIPYLVGIDPASGGGGDNFAITIVNPYNLQIAAEFKSKYISGPAAVRMLIELVQDYIPKAVLIPEKNNMGCYLIQMLMETSIVENLYWNDKNLKIEDAAEEDPKEAELKRLAMQYKKYGHWTGKNRGAMFELLFMHIAQCKQILCTEYLVDDICKLVKKPSGRIEAADGEHDDCVMSYLITLFVFYNADNLIQFGIDTSSCQPVAGIVDLDKKVDNRDDDTSNDYFATQKAKTFDEEVMEEIAREETRTKELVSRFGWVIDTDMKYNHEKLKNQGDTVDIGASFFDEINGF